MSPRKMQTPDLVRLTITVGAASVLMFALCGCVRTVYGHRDPKSLRVIRMERNGVSGVWMPDAWFSSIRANSACMLELMHEAEVESNQKGTP
jgi:hypothetical protein